MRHALRRQDVLHAPRDARQRSRVPGGDALVGGGGVGHRRLGRHGDVGAHAVVDAGDAVEDGAGQLLRADFASGQEALRLGDGEVV